MNAETTQVSTGWETPGFEVVETALEVTAYYLTD
ncbi:pyrroloquinoline quinone precursor peptide PqqA [Streptomyces sp. NPDC000594]